MGVLTRLYAVLAPLMKKIRANNELLGLLLGYEETKDDVWNVQHYDCGKKFEERLGIHAAAGCATMQSAFDFESPADDEPEYDGEDIRVAKPGPSLVGGVDSLKEFFATAADAGHFVLAAAS